MKSNVSNIDRIIRVAAGVILLYLGLGGVLVGAPAIIADVIGAVLILTGAISFCPIYALLKFSTKK